MLTQLFPFLDPSHATSDLVQRLRALADDAAHLKEVRSISPVLLQAAPLLKYWVPVQRPEGLRLIGQVSRHPLIKGPMIMTSPLWFADPEGNWIRTLSRFYRLGPPADPEAALIISCLPIKARDKSGDQVVGDRA